MADRVWLHLRKSRHLGDEDDDDLLATHRAILLRLAAGDGLLIPETQIVTEVESGEFLAQRPAFAALLRQWEALPPGAGGVLYVMALDRLSRGDELEQARVRFALRRAGIVLRTPSGSIDLADPDQSLLAGVRGELARHELARFKQRVELTRREKNRRGQVLTGAVPWGYDWDKNSGQPVPHPEEFPLLVRCCREILSHSVDRLAARYGVSASNLQRSLHSPVICGWACRRYTIGASRSGHRYGKPRPRAEWVWAEEPGPWQPACTRAEWEAIQAVMAARYSRREWTDREDGWCRDVVRFLGAPEGSWVRLQTGGVSPAYVLIGPSSQKPIDYISRRVVNDAVSAALAPLLSSPDLLARMAALHEQQQRAAALRTAPEGRAAAIRQELETQRAALDAAVRATLHQEGEVAAAYRRVQAEIDARIKRLVRELSQLGSTAPPPDLAPLQREMAILAGEFETAWPAAPGGLKRRLVRALIAAVPVRVTRTPGRRPLRELIGVEWQAWLRPLFRK